MYMPTSTIPASLFTTLTMECFTESLEEQKERERSQQHLFKVMMSMCALKKPNEHNQTLKNLKDFYALSDHNEETLSPSRIHYMEIIDENPDNNDTMKNIAEMLFENAASIHQDNYIVIVRDGKTYDHLIQIKNLYGAALQKLLIFPGDWHTLANYQPVIMKAYYHAGLKELAMGSGYRGETLNSLEKCSHFKRTHNFIIQAWQAIYLQMLNAYVNKKSLFQLTHNLSDILLNEEVPPKEIMKLVETIHTHNHYQNFRSFVTICSDQDDTWRFWSQFVFQDCLGYIGLYLAIRFNNWKLRVASLKNIAPLFSAYDRIYYQRLIPYHLADLQTFPLKF